MIEFSATAVTLAKINSPMKHIAIILTLASAAFTGSGFAQSQTIIHRMPATEVTLDALLAPATLFPQTKAEFMTAAKSLGFEWTSATQDSARSDRPNSKFIGQQVYETVIRFEGDKPKDATVLFYARGDSGELGKAKFDAMVKSSIAALDTMTATPFKPRGRDQKSAVKADGVFWQTDKAIYTLEYSATKEKMGVPYRSEFVRLEITPPAEKKNLLQTAFAAAKKFDPKSQVKKETGGDVFIPTVPMVDQGQKGYCAVATTERVLRYYGVSTDANEIAQIANSDASRGTSSMEMIGALKKVQGRLRIRVKPEIEPEYRDFTRLIEDYNRAAKKAKASELPDPKKFNVSWTAYSEMEQKILKEVKVKDNAGFTKFLRIITQHIDLGIPLTWSVQLGIVPEPNIPQGAGGHMRLIIGYNTQTKELIFSDSWGAGHEKKRMALDDAWSITTGLITIEPLQGGA